MTMTLTSTAFSHGGDIPAKYTCDDADVSPPLAWSGVPDTARSLVLIVDDPDAPDPAAPKTTWVHWIVYKLPPSITQLVEGIDHSALPAGAKEGQNDWKRIGYGGPCPPIGRHRYFFKLYALDKVLPETEKATKDQIEAAIQGHVLAKAELLGYYQH